MSSERWPSNVIRWVVDHDVKNKFSLFTIMQTVSNPLGWNHIVSYSLVSRASIQLTLRLLAKMEPHVKRSPFLISSWTPSKIQKVMALSQPLLFFPGTYITCLIWEMVLTSSKGAQINLSTTISGTMWWYQGTPAISTLSRLTRKSRHKSPREPGTWTSRVSASWVRVQGRTHMGSTHMAGPLFCSVCIYCLQGLTRISFPTHD